MLKGLTAHDICCVNIVVLTRHYRCYWLRECSPQAYPRHLWKSL